VGALKVLPHRLSGWTPEEKDFFLRQH
jgi:hypothetical protein